MGRSLHLLFSSHRNVPFEIWFSFFLLLFFSFFFNGWENFRVCLWSDSGKMFMEPSSFQNFFFLLLSSDLLFLLCYSSRNSAFAPNVKKIGKVKKHHPNVRLENKLRNLLIGFIPHKKRKKGFLLKSMWFPRIPHFHDITIWLFLLCLKWTIIFSSKNSNDCLRYPKFKNTFHIG